MSAIMIRVAMDEDGSSQWMYATTTLSGGTYSAVYQMPIENITAIGASITGSGSWEFTIDPPSTLDTTAEFVRWDGTSAINFAVTGFRLVRDSGTVVGKISVKTTYA